MKLYDSRRAPNPRRVRWVMAEKGIQDIEIVQVDLFAHQHRTPEYLAKAGLPNVPALELDDGATLTESVAICRYLESLYPEPNLFGVDPKETAVIEMWSRRCEFLLAGPLMTAVRHGHPALAALETQNPQTAAASRAAAERALDVFDRRLAESPFIAAARLTIADIIAYIGLDFARMVQFKPDEGLAHVNRWRDALRSRPGAVAGT